MTKKRHIRQQFTVPDDELNEIQVVEYDITTEPILDREYRKLPHSVQDAFERLHYEAQSQPKKAIPELLEWI
ncbi:MAG: hypothetical protein JW934_10115 [Anaerolineae bacterium]|nr:hypothetical protein [Anaerolineae bacterium]